ncbi:hypothetical protein Pmani_037520 [Petrolisthes manimaculis]|uniref:Kazal-like domain-containing protein n=1 Tax=Petrolisthes manimaculis TaxID=1843537 RepID=A0AAE1NI19_9EUCA|nr:hypothetical protein Pmani_037520 [Petrolisthes manimaculis]
MGVVLLLAPHVTPSPQLNRGVSQLTCPKSCEDSFRPVCGSDSTVYRNECHLRLAACKDDTIKKVNDGPCVRRETTSSSSSSSTSSSSSSSGTRRPSPSPSPCKEQCTKIFIPLCGSDGKSYNNLCIMEYESCRERHLNPNADPITVAHEGLCEDPKSDRPCQRTCSSTFDPVCGTDDNTYHNKCEMDVAKCLDDRVRQRFVGVCDVPNGSSGSRSSSGLRPSVTLRPEGTAPQASVVTPCEKSCTGFRPVCGSDGKTYGSDCHIENARCSNPTLRKDRDGVCPKDCSLVCDTREEPVCGNDGQTYKNLCFLIVARCKDPSLDINKAAPEGPCTRDSNVRPQCLLKCTDDHHPVCGSDGRTYRNRCQLEAATCTRQGLVRVSDGVCKS